MFIFYLHLVTYCYASFQRLHLTHKGELSMSPQRGLSFIALLACALLMGSSTEQHEQSSEGYLKVAPGVETIMVRYPREGHGVRETSHRVDLIDRSMAWYEKHFPSTESAAAGTPTK